MTRQAVHVVVPWRPDGGTRDAAWAYVRRWWAAAHPSWTVITGDSPGAAWCKATAVGDALSRVADGTSILVVADADVVCDPGALTQAVDWVETHGGWAVPARHVARLTEDATADVYRTGVHRRPRRDELAEREYVHRVAGGCVVLHSDDYRACPLDPRFEGWDVEDHAWARALSTMLGVPWRPGPDSHSGPMIHLWHAPALLRDERRATGSPGGAALYRRYQRASGNMSVMRRILDEARNTA